MYGPVSRVPESVSLGDHTIGGGQGSGVRTHIYIIYTFICIYTYVKYICVCNRYGMCMYAFSFLRG